MLCLFSSDEGITNTLMHHTHLEWFPEWPFRAIPAGYDIYLFVFSSKLPKQGDIQGTSSHEPVSQLKQRFSLLLVDTSSTNTTPLTLLSLVKGSVHSLPSLPWEVSSLADSFAFIFPDFKISL